MLRGLKVAALRASQQQNEGNQEGASQGKACREGDDPLWLDERQPPPCSWDAISLSVISLGQGAYGLRR